MRCGYRTVDTTRVSYAPGMLKGLRTYGLVSAIVLITFATLLISPPTRVAKTGPSPAAAIPKKVSSPVSQLPGPPERANRDARESAYAKLGLDGKLIIKQTHPRRTTHRPGVCLCSTDRTRPRTETQEPRACGGDGAPVLPEATREAPAQKIPCAGSPHAGDSRGSRGGFSASARRTAKANRYHVAAHGAAVEAF